MNGRKLALEAGAVDRRRVIRDIVAGRPIGSQAELAEVLVERGYAVTQATISRDIAELGLVKVTRGDRHAYVSTDDLGPPGGGRRISDDRLRRILADIPVRVGRSGLVLLLTGKARWEETRLMRRFKGYAGYAARTPRFVPRLRR